MSTTAISRIWITGSSGAGKSTLARELAGRLEVPHLELDALHHLEGWTPVDPEVMRGQVATALQAPGWVVDGNYTSILGSMVAESCQLRIVLDLPIGVLLARVSRRTLRRMATQEELWNGNREPWSNLMSWDPQRNLIRWTWTRRRAYRRKAHLAELEARTSGPPCVRLTSPAQVRRFVRYLIAR